MTEIYGKNNAYKTLETPYKQARVNPNDGYTIVFISSDGDKKYLNGDVDDIKLDNKHAIKHLITSPANKVLKEGLKKAVDQANDCGARLKIFDINNLTSQDYKYLKENNIVVPEDPDIFVRNADTKQLSGNKMFGFSYCPKKGGICYINIPEGYEGFIYHELGHSLGLKHSFEKGYKNNKVLDKQLDNTDNTTMSYAVGKSEFGFREFDKQALRHMYGMTEEYLKGHIQNILDNDYKSIKMEGDITHQSKRTLLHDIKAAGKLIDKMNEGDLTPEFKESLKDIIKELADNDAVSSDDKIQRKLHNLSKKAGIEIK